MLKITKTLGAAVLAALAALGAASPASANSCTSYCSSPWTIRVSLTDGDQQASADSGLIGKEASLSGDGRYVAFGSDAALVPQDANGFPDVYVRDRAGTTTTLVSWSMGGGVAANGTSTDADISANGRYVAFASTAPDVAPGGAGAGSQVYVRDLQMGTTVSAQQGQSTGLAKAPRISSDGRYVAFVSDVALVGTDTNGKPDLYVRDMQNATFDRISVPYTGARQDEGAGWVAHHAHAMSSDGRHVVFSNHSSSLVPGDTNGQTDVFLRDRVAGTTARVSVSTQEAEADGQSGDPSVSDDGKRVVFGSWATNLLQSDANPKGDVFLRDLSAGTTTLVSKSTGGLQGNGTSGGPSISANGRYVAFTSWATNLVGSDGNGYLDVYLRDLQANTTALVSRSSSGAAANSWLWRPEISDNGAFVAFASSATNLVQNDTNQKWDVFLRKL